MSNDYPARQLPSGYAASGWVSLDESGRALLVDEVLSMNENLFIDGTINYLDSREPIFTNKITDNYETLAGDIIPWESLATDMGTIYGKPNNLGIWFMAAAAFLLLIGVS